MSSPRSNRSLSPLSPTASVLYSPKPKKSILKRRPRDLETDEFNYGLVDEVAAKTIVNNYNRLFNATEKNKLESLLRGQKKTVSSREAIASRKKELKLLRDKLNFLDDHVTTFYMNKLQKYRGHYDEESNKMNKKYFDILYEKKHEFETKFLQESAAIMLAGGLTGGLA